MGRLIVLVLLAVIAVWLVRRALRAPGQSAAERSPPPVEGLLVRCAHCGMYLPRAEARSAAGAEYCSEEHARLGPGKR